MIRSCDSDIIFAGVDQGGGFAGPEVEEARACLFGFKCVFDLGLKRIVVEGDCLPLIQKLRQRHLQDNVVGVFVKDILLVSRSFSFLSW